MKVRVTIQRIDSPKKKRVLYFREEDVPENMTPERAVHWLLAHANECFPQEQLKSINREIN